MKKRITALAALACAAAWTPAAHADVIGFSGPLAPANWQTTIAGPSFGAGVSSAAAPVAITLSGGNDAAGVGCPDGTAPGFSGGCEIRYTVNYAADFRFHWTYTSADVSPQYDSFGMLVDGVRTTLVANGGDLLQSGDVAVHAGSSFGWYINCTDCTQGAAQVTITALSAVPEAGTAALLACGMAGLAGLSGVARLQRLQRLQGPAIRRA